MPVFGTVRDQNPRREPFDTFGRIVERGHAYRNGTRVPDFFTGLKYCSETDISLLEAMQESWCRIEVRGQAIPE
jgi:hypothetical protein